MGVMLSEWNKPIQTATHCRQAGGLRHCLIPSAQTVKNVKLCQWETNVIEDIMDRMSQYYGADGSFDIDHVTE